jgi:hypothetical protein
MKKALIAVSALLLLEAGCKNTPVGEAVSHKHGCDWHCAG